MDQVLRALLNSASHFALKVGERIPKPKQKKDYTFPDIPKPKLKREISPIERLAHKMTNWERTQWARAGYPQSEKKMKAIMGNRANSL